MVVLWSLVGFLSGSIPFSLVIGRAARKVDIRNYGDHNPGAWNVMRAAGWKWGIAALLFDSLKGAIPVGLAFFYAGIIGWELVPVAISPILGHAFSPWLGFKGGKAVATSFGIWSGLTVGTGPIVLGLILGLFYFILESSAWAVMITFMAFGWLIWQYYSPQFPEFTWIWLGNLSILFWKHREELSQPPRIHPELMKFFRRRP